MKKMFFAVLGLSTILGAACTATRTAAGSEADRVTTELIGQMLDTKLYKIDFDRAFPVGAPSFVMTDPYFISVIGDRVESFLPYFGRSYSAIYGGTGEEGLRFEAPIIQYTVRRGRGGRWDISLTAQTDLDTYDLNLRILPTGETSLEVSSIRKQSISFTGTVDMDPDFESARRVASE